MPDTQREIANIFAVVTALGLRAGSSEPICSLSAGQSFVCEEFTQSKGA